MNYSFYFQANIKKELSWMLMSTLKYSEHVVFSRALDKATSLFEFFVAPGLEDVFLDIMHKLEQQGVVFNLQRLPNRYQEEL